MLSNNFTILRVWSCPQYKWWSGRSGPITVNATQFFWIPLYRGDTEQLCFCHCPTLTFQDTLPRGKANFQYSFLRQHSNALLQAHFWGLPKEGDNWGVFWYLVLFLGISCDKMNNYGYNYGYFYFNPVHFKQEMQSNEKLL